MVLDGAVTVSTCTTDFCSKGVLQDYKIDAIKQELNQSLLVTHPRKEFKFATVATHQLAARGLIAVFFTNVTLMGAP